LLRSIKINSSGRPTKWVDSQLLMTPISPSDPNTPRKKFGDMLQISAPFSSPDEPHGHSSCNTSRMNGSSLWRTFCDPINSNGG
jgi:hypothetical protein